MISINISFFKKLIKYFSEHTVLSLIIFLSVISILSFLFNYYTGYGLLYNDARSRLDIARRVVESLKPGLAQLGSVWLPLPHVLMLPTVWNSQMWQSGFSGAILSMTSYVITGVLIYLFLRTLGVTMLGRLAGVLFFALNLNILYMQSTAMTELLLLCAMTAAVYELVIWYKNQNLFRLVRAAFWVLLSTLIRYDGWFLFIFAVLAVLFRSFRLYGYKRAEGAVLLFTTLAGFGIFLWFLWNFLIFNDPLYFAYGPYSANTQQEQLETAGALPTKHNLFVSFITYLYAVTYNTNPFFVLLACAGAIFMLFDKKNQGLARMAMILLFVPFIFNIVSLYLGHSSLYVKDLIGAWFNIRYGLMMVPSIAIFIGYLIYRLSYIRHLYIALFFMITFFGILNMDAVTLDDARIGSSGKNVVEVSGWLNENAADREEFVLISVASHDAIIFSSGLMMSRFIHEGTGDYWELALKNPSKWARWIIMRTYDDNDNTYRLLKGNIELERYDLVHQYPFADIYELKPGYLDQINTKLLHL